MAEKKKKLVAVTCKLLNVRMKPDITSSVVRQVGEGAQLEKISTVQKGEWTKIPDGYVMSKFVS